MTLEPSEDSDQPGHPPSLIRVFVVRMKEPLGPYYSLSAQRRLRSDWSIAQADLSLRWAHRSFCWFCYDVAHFFTPDGGYFRASYQTTYARGLNVHIIASPGIIGHVFFPGISQSDSVLLDGARPNPNPSINPGNAEAAQPHPIQTPLRLSYFNPSFCNIKWNEISVFAYQRSIRIGQFPWMQ